MLKSYSSFRIRRSRKSFSSFRICRSRKSCKYSLHIWQYILFITYLAIEKNFVIRKFSHFRICLRFCHWNSNLSFDSFDLAFQIRICHNKKIHSTVKNFSQKILPPPHFSVGPLHFSVGPSILSRWGDSIFWFWRAYSLLDYNSAQSIQKMLKFLAASEN